MKVVLNRVKQSDVYDLLLGGPMLVRNTHYVIKKKNDTLLYTELCVNS